MPPFDGKPRRAGGGEGVFVNVEQRHPAEAAQPQPGRPGGRRWGGQGAAGAFRSRPRRSYNLSGLLGTQRYFLGFWEVRRPRSVSLAMVKESAGQSFWRLQERLRSLVFLSFWRCPHSLAGGPFLLTPPPPASALWSHPMTLTVLGPGLPSLPQPSSAFHRMAFWVTSLSASLL